MMDIGFIRSTVVATMIAYIRAHTGAIVEPAVFDDLDLLFSSLDLDSLDVMMLAEELSEKLEIEMELTALIDYPTVGQLTRHIHGLLGGAGGDGAGGGGDGNARDVRDGASIDSARYSDERPTVSIVCAKHRLPRGASAAAAASASAAVGSFADDTVVTIPLERWDVEDEIYGVHGVRFGAFLESIEAFDPTPWGLSAGECELMDPQQRLVLESVAELVLDATSSSGGKPAFDRAGVFVGASASEYQSLIDLRALVQTLSPYAVTAGGIGVIPGRVAYHLGMQGPALATDTACSSSLVSVGVAVGMMERGALAASFACGCNVMLDKRGFQLFQAANMLAMDGRCKAMDAAGDGFSRGEAVTSFALAVTVGPGARASAAGGEGGRDGNSDGDDIPMCVIRSVSINQDGRSSRLTAPNGPAQSTLIADALQHGGMLPGDVASLMLHGTGTPLGDPIEIGAALKMFAASLEQQSCVLNLSAVKTVHGHSEAAAGAVSLAGAVHMEAYRATNPTLHLRIMNENVVRLWDHHAIQVSRSPGGVPTSRSRSSDRCRAVGVSSFASQGTNCHIIISHEHATDCPTHSSDGSVSSRRPVSHGRISHPVHRPEALPWARQSIWILPRLSSRLRLTSMTHKRVEFVLRDERRGSDIVGDPDWFLSSLAVAARRGVELLRDAPGPGRPEHRVCILGLFVNGVGRETDDLRLILVGGSVTASAGSTTAAATVGAPIGIAGVHERRLLDSSGLKHRMLGIDDRHTATVPSAVASVVTGDASRPTFTLALARSAGAPPSRRVFKSADAALLDDDDNGCCGDAFAISHLPGQCRLPNLALVGTVVFTEEEAVRSRADSSDSSSSMERYHVMLADVPVCHVGDSSEQPRGVSINGCRISCRPPPPTATATSLEAANVTTALTLLHHSIALVNKTSLEPHPGVVASLCAGTNAHHDLGFPRRPSVRAFDVSVDSMARSVVREMSDGFHYMGSPTITCGVRSVSSLERRARAHDGGDWPLHPMQQARLATQPSQPLVIHGGTGGLGEALCQCFRTHRAPLIVSSRSGLMSGTSGGRLAATGLHDGTQSADLLVIRRSISGLQEDDLDSKEHARLNVREFRLVLAAGVLRDARLCNQTPAMVREMLAPKVLAAELAFGAASGFRVPVMAAYAFSSVAALLHPAGSSTYGAINAVMESIATKTMCMGIESVAIQWGAWSSIGMVSTSHSVERAMRKMGVGMIRPVDGLAAFLALFGRPHADPVLACVPFAEPPVAVHRIDHSYQSGQSGQSDQSGQSGQSGQSRQSDDRNDREGVVERIRRVLAAVLGHPIDSATESLVHYGADSLCAIDIQQTLSSEFDIVLPPTVLYDYPTIDAMATAVVGASAGPTCTAIRPAVRPPSMQDTVVGIESMTLRSPASVDGDVTTDCTTVAAYERWDVDELATDAPKARFGKFLSGYELFDAELFRITAQEAVSMDPQQRILLEDSFAVAGTATPTDVGVIVGMSFWDYSTISEQLNGDMASQSHAMKLTGRNLSVASGRISYSHGYRGPAMTIDTACSSSLVAVHMATSMLAHDTPAPSKVLVGSAMLSLAPDVMRSLSMASMISDEGRSRTLDRLANGYGRGEATAVLVMRNTSRVTRDVRLAGVVVGSVVNQDGRSASLTAPNGPSQLDLLRQAFAKANVRPFDILLHELHGTGTPLGDPIEMAAVAKAQEGGGPGATPSPAMVLAATKTAFGHAEPAAGCVGLYSIVGQMFDRARHPLLHLGSVSQHVEHVLAGSDRGAATGRVLVPSRSIAPLPEGTTSPSLASDSAFAFQGTNAHVIVESGGSAGVARCLPAEVANAADPNSPVYRGQRHWFAGIVHSWMHPTMHLDARRNPHSGDAMTWAAHPGRRVMHAMRQHRVFGKILLPGMAIFRIMSDVGALTVAGERIGAPEPRSSDLPLILLCASSIHTPVILDDQSPDELTVRLSRGSGRVRISRHMGADDVASGEIALAARSAARRTRARAAPASAALRSTLRTALRSLESLVSPHSTRNTDCISVGSLACSPDSVHDETITEPSIEALDSSTHLAAYRESRVGLLVSVPVSCDAMDITFHRTPYCRPSRRAAATVSCSDDGSNRDGKRARGYNIRSPGYGERRLRSLHSKVIGAPRRRAVDHVAEQVQVGEIEVGRADGRVALGRSLQQPVERSLAFHECIRAFLIETKSIAPPARRDPMLDGQLRVASCELGWSLARPTVMTPVPCPTTATSLDIRDGSRSALHVMVGGTSGIGQAMAGWAAARESRWDDAAGALAPDHLLLVGRRGVLGAASSISFLKRGMCTVSSLDCSRRTDAGALLGMCSRAATPRCALVHAAGVIHDEAFLASTSRAWRIVFAPKYSGLLAVSSIAAAMPVEDLLAMSTASIDIGNRGQANYVSANLAMEGLSHGLRRSGIPSQIVRYGPWKAVGMLSGTTHSGTKSDSRASVTKIAAQLSRMGLTLMTPLEGIRATVDFLRSKHACATIGLVDWPTAIGSGSASGPAGDVVRTALGGLPAFESMLTRNRILKTIQDIAGDEADFFGLDSLASMEIRNRLSAALATPLPPTLLFDYPTVDKLMDHLVARFVVPSPTDAVARSGAAGGGLARDRLAQLASTTLPPLEALSSSIPTVYVSRTSQMIPHVTSTSFEAISGVFRDKENLQRPVPLDRWDQDARFGATGPQSVYTNFAAFVDRLWAFDAGLFGMKTHEVLHTDPQARCLLTTAATALGGQGRRRVAGNSGGVFVGCMFYDYLRSFEVPNKGLESSVVLGNGSPYLSGRLAYTFDLDGPCVGIDTACSSSLVAIHSGRTEIQTGSIGEAVVSGANAIILPQTSALICQLGALSRTGRCLSLDATADGYGRGEAFVTCILSRDTDDETLAVLRATSVNQDGRSISLTAPNGPSQERLIFACLAAGRIRPDDVRSVSIHGTGTLLGDPIETQALSNAYMDVGAPTAVPVTIVANKALLGHCEGAAGTTGLLNALCSAYHRHAYGIHTLRDTNPYLVLGALAPRRASGPVLPPAQGTSTPLASGTSSFGMSGTNAHGIVTPHEAPLDAVRGHRGASVDPRSCLRERLFPQSGPAGRIAFVPMPSGGLLLFHVRYTQSHASDLCDHRVRVGSGADPVRPLLAAATQLEVAASLVNELASDSGRDVLHGVAFIRPVIFLGGSHETMVEMDVTRGAISLWDGLERRGASGATRPHAAASVGRAASWDSMTMQSERLLRRFPALVLPARTGNIRNTAVVRRRGVCRGLASAAIDASLHLSVVGQTEHHEPEQKVPVSCDAVMWEPSMRFTPPETSLWATDHRLGAPAAAASAASTATSFCAVGLVSRPFNRLNKLKGCVSSSVWTASLVDPLRAVPAGPAPARVANAARPAAAFRSLRAIQLLQQGHVADLERSKLPYMVVQALRRVHANEAGRHAAVDDSFLSPLDVPQTSVSSVSSADVALTSLGGIGSLVALYQTAWACDVRACCRTQAGRRRFERHLASRSIQSAGANVTVVNFDLAHREDVRAFVVPSVGITMHHTAGTLRDAMIPNVTRADVAATQAPKLHVLEGVIAGLGACAVDSICAFSSIASIFGTRGQATYAMANAAMDELVTAAWSCGVPCVAVQWGLWEQHDAGMTASLSHIATTKLASLGYLRLSPVEGLGYLERCLAVGSHGGAPTKMVSKMDEAVLLSRAIEAPIPDGVSTAAFVRKMDIAEVLRRVFYQTASEAVDETAPILQQGLDSVSSVEFTQALESAVGLRLPQTLVYDYPMLEDMVAYIRDSLGDSDRDGDGETARATLPLPRSRSVPTASSAPVRPRIAIVSECSRYPTRGTGGRHAPFEVDGAAVLRRAPFHSFDSFASAFDHDELYAFDADLFRLGRGAALSMDPNIRWLLTQQVGLLAAGADAAALAMPSSDAGVFLGWMWSHEHSEGMEVSPNAVTSTSAPFAVGYVAYLMQMCGPCMPVDTACSSSLVALHLAKAAIEQDDCSMASVNGINAFLSVATWSKIQSILAGSRDGRCKTLDAAADGYGRGEAFVSMLLREVFEHDIDTSLAIVSGSACSTAGRRSALTAPNGPAQTAVVQEALRRAQRPSLDGVGLHGTGTVLGDPIEIRSLLTSLPTSQSFHLSAPKAAVGHTEGAAGLTNVLAAIANGSQRRVAPFQNLVALNKLLFADLRGFVPRQAGPAVTAEHQRTRAVGGCSSFGMSGVNAHVIASCSTYDRTPDGRAGQGFAKRAPVFAPSADRHVLVPGSIGSAAGTRRRLVTWHLIPSMDEARVAWLTDHVVNGHSILPGTFFLAISEMVCEALHQSPHRSHETDGSPVLGNTIWTRSVPVHDIMQIRVITSDDGIISCGSAFATVPGLAAARATAADAPAAVGASTRPSIRPLSGVVRPCMPIQSHVPTVIARLGSTCAYTGDARFPAVARTDAALHLTATATATAEAGQLYVPVSLESYISHRSRLLDTRRPLGSFVSGMCPASTDSGDGRRVVGACASEDMALADLVGSSLGPHDHGSILRGIRAVDGIADTIPFDDVHHVAERAADMTYVLEMVADGCAASELSIDREPLPRSRLSIWTSPSSFAANVAALQAAPDGPAGPSGGAPVGLVHVPIDAFNCDSRSYVRANRLLMDVYRAETGRVGCVPAGKPRAAGPWAPPTAFRQAVVPARRVHRDAFPVHLPTATASKMPETTTMTTDSMHPAGVRVRVQSVALNFRDFLLAMGLYPSAVDPASMGSDFAGTIVDVGITIRPECSLKIGDRVFGQSKGVFKDRISVAAELVAPVPSVVTAEEASTLSTVFLTAVHCIKCIACVHSTGQRQRSLLIHAASGGLGLALAQVARARGMTVLGTAGSPFKRSYVRNQGIDVACNSRDLEFADILIGEPSLATQGVGGVGGVGAVVNTLTSPGMIAASQSILALGGHFIEVSKRDIFSHARILQDRPDLRYHIVAVDMMPAEALSGDLTEIAAMLARGDIAPIPATTYSLSQMSRAMSRFKSSRAIGKTVCSRASETSGEGPRATWLVTGGAGALGAVASSLLIETGNVELVLPIRRLRDSGTGDSMGVVRSASASVVNLVLADVGVRADFAFLETTKVHGLVHSSGTLRDGLIPGIRSTRPSDEVFAAKSAPMLGHLRGTSGTFLSAAELVVSFSSVSSVIPNPGQGNYAWANALLDGAAEEDAHRGRRHVVINWGPWAGGGMAAHLDERALSGVRMIDPKLGSFVLEGLLRGNTQPVGAPTGAAVGRIVCLAATPARRAELLGGSSSGSERDEDTMIALTPATEVPASSWDVISVTLAIQGVVAGLLDDANRDALTTSVPLMQAGLDSLGSIEVVTALKAMFDIPLSQTFPFDCPTIDSMVEHIAPLVVTAAPAASPPATPADPAATPAAFDHTDVYILDWMAALPATRPVPFDRWDPDRSAGPAPPRFGGFVDSASIERFDNQAFGVSLKESVLMDPQHRILLMQVMEVRGECIPQTAVAVGIGRLEDPWHVLYATDSLIREGNGLVSTSRAASASAGRISYHFDFRGGCLAIDTACSSSLVALRVLFETLARGSDARSRQHGILGGVNLPMSHQTSAMLGASAMLAADGRCKTLDERADGYGRSEGAAVLKMSNQFDESTTAGQMPVAVIGAAVNQDGRSAGLTAPSGPAQEAVVRAAVAGIASVYVAGMHGTGTPLGDPIEVSSLQRVFKGMEGQAKHVTLVASKAALGHAETASGIFGLLANVRMTSAMTIDAMPSLRTVNRHVFIDSMAVLRQPGPCVAAGGRHATPYVTSFVSAFAFQGSNASAAVSSFPWDGGPARAAPNSLSTLSAVSVLPALPAGHPLITHVRFDKNVAFECRIMHPSMHLSDHRVAGSAIFPASGYVEVMSAAAETMSGSSSGTKVDDLRVPTLANIGYNKPYLMDPADFYLVLEVDVVSGRTTVSDAVDLLCSAMVVSRTVPVMDSMVGRTECLPDESGNRMDGNARSTRGAALAAVRIGYEDVPAVTARTSMHDGHIVHCMDSSWHLCAFFVALEERQDTAPALRIPRTLGAFCRQRAAGSGHQTVDVSLSRRSYGMFQTISSYFSGAGLHLDRVVKTQAGVARPVPGPVTVPVYAMRSLTAQVVQESPRSGVRLSHSTHVGTLLSALQLGVVPDSTPGRPSGPSGPTCSSRSDAVLGAGVDVAGCIQDGPRPVAPTHLKDRLSIDAVGSRVDVHSPAAAIDRETTVVVAGGAGAVGSLVRKFVAMQASGAHVVSVSRTIRMNRSNALTGSEGSNGLDRVAREERAGHASMVCADAALDGLDGVCGSPACRPRKIAVINAAGVLIDQPLRDADMASARAVFAPKHAGTAALARSAGARPVTFLHCGSIAALFGNEGQASYIIANAIMNRLSERLCEQGVPSVVVHFGPFAGLGRGMASATVQRTLQRRGVPLLSPFHGLCAFNTALSSVLCDQVCAFDHVAYFATLAAGDSPMTAATAAAATASRVQVRNEREPALVIISKIVDRLVDGGSSDGLLAAGAKFVDLGLDSLAAVEFAEALRQEFGMSFTNTVVFDYPTVDDLATHVNGMRAGRGDQAVAAAGLVRSHDKSDSRNRPVAIVAATHRFPNGGWDDSCGVGRGPHASTSTSRSATTRWTAGIEIQSLVPPARWDLEAIYAPAQMREHMYVRVGGWLDRVDMFDHAAFGLSRDEGLAMDPQLRLLLELTHELTHGLDHGPTGARGAASLSKSTNLTSNFAGCMYQEYLDGVLGPAGMADTTPAAITSTGMSFLVGRLSYHFNLRGQSVACDTACSSSLVAVHLARAAIRDGPGGPGRRALAHGVNMMLSPQTTSRICMLQALSPVGRCKTSDASADGYGRSESGMSVLLGGWPDEGTAGAEGTGEALAHLLGCGIGHNGTTGGISAPHGPSQTRLIADVWAEAGVDVLGATSLHGTGTALGDPIEFQALQAVLQRRWNASKVNPGMDMGMDGDGSTTPTHPPMPLIATKAWCGHMEGTAGLVGLMLPVLENRTIAPMVHLRTLNEHISRQGLRDVYVSRGRGGRGGRGGGVSSSSFGMGGTNAHAVVDVDVDANDDGGALDIGTGGRTPIYKRERCWPTVGPAPVVVPQRLLQANAAAVILDIDARHTFWMQDHVVGGKQLVAGATMLHVISDAGSAAIVHHQSAAAVASIVFVTSVEVAPTMRLSLSLVSSSGSGSNADCRAVFSVAGVGACTASYARVADMVADRAGEPPTSSRLQAFRAIIMSSSIGSTGQPVSPPRTRTVVASIDRRVHPHLSSLAPCVADASMHLGLVTVDEGRIPVSAGVFLRDTLDPTTGVPTVSSASFGVGTDAHMDARSEKPDAMLCEVRSKPLRLTVTRRPMVDLRGVLPSRLSDSADVSVSAPKSKSESESGLVTVGHTTRLHSAGWQGLFSAVAQTLRDDGGSRITISSTTSMGKALAAVVDKEHPERLAGNATTSEFVSLPLGDAVYSETNAFNVVTGAFGGIGTVVAEWLAAQGAPAVLLGRRVRLAHPGSQGPRLAVLMQCDTSSSSDLRAALDNLTIGTLHHAAGTVKDAAIVRTTPANVRAVAAPKASDPVRSFIDFGPVLGGARAVLLYSSITGVTGNRGQISYAYANGLLNRLAEVHSDRGMSSYSIAWGAWAGKGMANGLERALAASGVGVLRPVDGLRVLEDLLATQILHNPIVVAGVFDNVDALLAGGHETPGLAHGTSDGPAGSAGPIPTPSSSVELSPVPRMDPEAIESLVRSVLEDAVGEASDESMSALDSLTTVSISDKLASGLGVTLSPTLLYDYPTVNSLCQHLVAIQSVADERREAERRETEARAPTPSAITTTSPSAKTTIDVPIDRRVKRFALRDGYYCSPPVDVLNSMDDDELRAVNNLVIGREKHGSVHFLSSVDLTQVDLKREVHIGRRGMSMSQGSKPGERLNQPALARFTAPQLRSSAVTRRRVKSALARTLHESTRLVFIDEDAGCLWLMIEDWF